MSLTLHQEISLKPYNSFGLNASARHYAELETLADLPALLACDAYRQGPVLWLGGGSNMLFTRDYPGLVVRMATRGIRIIADSDTHIELEAAAGEVWHDFVLHTLKMGLSGLENLSLIPGTVGASPVQNIGAYGVEVKDVISEVVCADLAKGGAEVVLPNSDCRFAYRDSIFKREAGARLLVTAVRFRLAKAASLKTAYGDIARELDSRGISTPTARDVSQAVIAIRSQKLPDPAQLGNAGSFFKNPIVDASQAAALLARHPALPHYPAGEGRVKLAAGWLIDQAGLKGYREGDAGVHAKQALVLVNYGTASGSDIWALADKVRLTVAQHYGVDIEPEPIVI
ncbi:UDP-N-acetylmuramate dehydrogenase [Craterilacuibacter sp. RT1T]|uniref:UDP-N-acetylmuramate dehydrogenase n=1 Tax=Craterilacuibacter sp. RT1T TaxID=2942211 RepID=UPI0020C065D6|nr:UDP-N-acetylmuramate dehydrogenase [Craterilacuibacter sp. RT1T]MCL6262353.1 UDP-N-acetylmuramate dehydrogenase [Craterilacuibacter sp. RT1T]